MDGTGDFVATQRRDQPLDLTPVAEMDDIAAVTRLLGADRRFEPGVIAVALDEVGSVGQSWTAVDEGAVHKGHVNPDPLSRLPRSVVNVALTMFALHGRAMTKRATRAGGFFLMLCIVAGFPLGLAIGNPMKGILIGTGVGIGLALVLWLLDRRRSG